MQAGSFLKEKWILKSVKINPNQRYKQNRKGKYEDGQGERYFENSPNVNVPFL